MTTFKAYRVHTVGGKPVCKFEQLTMDDLDPGDVVIKTAYSAITYKDAMAARGVGKTSEPIGPVSLASISRASSFRLWTLAFAKGTRLL